ALAADVDAGDGRSRSEHASAEEADHDVERGQDDSDEEDVGPDPLLPGTLDRGAGPIGARVSVGWCLGRHLPPEDIENEWIDSVRMSLTSPVAAAPVDEGGDGGGQHGSEQPGHEAQGAGGERGCTRRPTASVRAARPRTGGCR